MPRRPQNCRFGYGVCHLRVWRTSVGGTEYEVVMINYATAGCPS